MDVTVEYLALGNFQLEDGPTSKKKKTATETGITEIREDPHPGGGTDYQLLIDGEIEVIYDDVQSITVEPR